MKNDVHDTNKGNYLQKYLISGYSLFCIVFSFRALLGLQGLDVTDLGRQTTTQVSSYSFPVETSPVYAMSFLTDFIGGFWLSLAGNPDVLWIKIGGALVLALNVPIVYSILKNYFDKKQVFVVVLISTLFLTMRYSENISQYTFPALLLTLETWAFNKVLISSDLKEKYLYSYLCGFLTVPIVLGRLPLIMIFIFPALVIAYYMITKRDLTEPAKLTLPALTGLLSSGLLFGMFYWQLQVLDYWYAKTFASLTNAVSDQLQAVVNGISMQIADTIHSISSRITGLFADDTPVKDTTVSDNISAGPAAENIIKPAREDHIQVKDTHSLGFLFDIYLRDLLKIGRNLTVLMVFIYIMSLIRQKAGKRNMNIFLLGFTVLLAGLISITGYSMNYSYHLLKLTIGVIALLCLIYVATDRGTNRNITLLMLLGLTAMLINFVGSNSGMLKAFYGMWMILPLSILCACEIQKRVRYEKLSGMLALTKTFLVIMLVLGLMFQATNTFREDQNRLHLDTGFSHESLKGIHSTPERVEAVDEVLIQIQRYSDSNDEVLMVNSIPLFYYLTETKPVYGTPWAFQSSLESLKAKQESVEKRGEYPKLLVYSKVDTRDRYWPDTDNIAIKEDLEKYDYIRNKYINELNYSLLWENRAFAIYSKPEDI